MSKQIGHLFIVGDEQHSELIETEHIDVGRQFTDVVQVSAWKPKPKSLCLLSLDGITIKSVALARNTERVATGKVRILFSHFVPLQNLPLEDVANHLKPRLKNHFERVVSDGGGKIPPATWTDVLESIRKLRPAAAPKIADLLVKFERGATRYVGDAYNLIAQQRDALMLSLKMFGLEPLPVLDTWQPSEDGQVLDFMAGLNVNLFEDHMIIHDSRVAFDGWNLLNKDSVKQIFHFRHNNEYLTVINANRTPIENTLGVDLLYYHHAYRAFVLVQYKRMRRKEENEDWEFRPTESSYLKQLERMKKFVQQHPHSLSTEPDDFRLHSNPFYFKLCRDSGFDPHSRALLKGIYLPLEYWETLTQSEQTLGPRGGRRITYNNVGRYLTNTHFVNLLQDGWIGSAGSVSDAIQLAAMGVEEKRSVTVAVSQTNDEAM